MATSNELFNNSELSMASYANLSIGRTDDASNLIALKSTDAGGAGMTEEQASQFSDRYTNVIAIKENTASGFSATVFQAADGSMTVAIRGTDPQGSDTWID